MGEGSGPEDMGFGEGSDPDKRRDETDREHHWVGNTFYLCWKNDHYCPKGKP